MGARRHRGKKLTALAEAVRKHLVKHGHDLNWRASPKFVAQYCRNKMLVDDLNQGPKKTLQAMCVKYNISWRTPPKKRRNFSNPLYDSWEWKTLRYRALKEYGARCMLCGSVDNIQVDHIKPVSRHPHLKLYLDNLQVLRADCNKGKGAWDETDFRDRRATAESPLH